MPEHMFKCDDCGTITSRQLLVERSWKCDCSAILAPMPTEKQVALALDLKIDGADRMTLPEIQPLIAARLADKRAYDEALRDELRRLRHPGVRIDEATAQQLVEELPRRNLAALLLWRPKGQKADQTNIWWSERDGVQEAVSELALINYYLATEQLPHQRKARASKN